MSVVLDFLHAIPIPDDTVLDGISASRQTQHSNAQYLYRALGWRGIEIVVATFRFARLTLQTRKHWLVGRCSDRPQRALPLTCPNVNNKKKMKRNASRMEEDR